MKEDDDAMEKTKNTVGASVQMSGVNEEKAGCTANPMSEAEIWLKIFELMPVNPPRIARHERKSILRELTATNNTRRSRERSRHHE